MQNFTAEKWADKIALFIDNFGFLSGFFWHWTIALPSPTSHLAMLHSKIILSDPNRRVKVVLHRLFLILKPMQKMEYIRYLFKLVNHQYYQRIFGLLFSLVYRPRIIRLWSDTSLTKQKWIDIQLFNVEFMHKDKYYQKTQKKLGLVDAN